MWKILFAILSVATLFISPDCGGNNDIKVTEAWAVMAPANTDANAITGDTNPAAFVYLTIANNAKEVDSLMTVSSPVAQSAGIVQTVLGEDGAQLQPLPNIQIKPDHKAALKPGKTLIRLSGLQQPLVAGSSFQLTLGFQNAGEIKQSVLVEAQGSKNFDN